MFDSHIQYYAYDNTDGDEFGVGYLGNAEFWTHIVNGWLRNDGVKKRVTVEEFEDFDLRGCVLAEVEPDDDGYLVSWEDKTIRIKPDWVILWEVGTGPIPRWINRLKNQLKEAQS